MKEKEFQAVQHLLPESVRNLIDVIGYEKAYLMVKYFGGTTFPFSKNRNSWGHIRHEMIAEVLDVTAADILKNHYGGECLYIPKCEAAMIEARDRVIRGIFDRETKSTSAITVANSLAQQFKLSDRHIWRILKAVDNEAEGAIQENLFEV